MKKSIVVIILLCATFILTVPYAYAQNFPAWPIDKIAGENAPDFVLKDMSGKNVSLSSYKGKPVLLNFWATWCTYCRQERRSLRSLHEEYKGKDLIIIAVSIDKSSKTVREYLEKDPAPYIVLTDPEGRTAGPYNVMSLPTTYLVDSHGKISRKFMGMVNWSDAHVKEYVENLIKLK